MAGTIPLTQSQVEQVLGSFHGKTATRNIALFTFLCYSGYRISEALSLNVGDIYQLGQLVDRVVVAKSHMKFKKKSRDCILNPRIKRSLGVLIEELKRKSTFGPELYLFQSQIGPNKSLSRIGAWKMLKKAFAANGITGKVACHSARKFFAMAIYENTKDIQLCSASLFHSQIQTTMRYISYKSEDVDKAVLSI